MVIAPRGHVVEARDQVRDSRLAAAWRPDDADGLARPCFEGNAGKRRTLARALIAETDIVEAQHALGDDELPGVGRVLDVELSVEQFE
jgi:hypothetical protein